MQHASLYAAAVLTGTLIAACASSDPGPEPTQQPTQSAPANEPAPSGGGSATKPPDKPADCTSTKCSTDSDCTAACGGGGKLGCCDTHTNTCYNSSASACPAPADDDAGTTTAGY